MNFLNPFILSITWLTRKTKGFFALVRFYALVPNVGKKTYCPLSVELKYPKNIKIGNFVAIGPLTTIGALASVTIEDYVRISKGVTIETGGLDLSSSLPYKHLARPIVIKKGAWLGARCIILGGVTIGEQAVIGAGAIVSKDVPAFTVVVSQPMRTLNVKTSKKN